MVRQLQDAFLQHLVHISSKCLGLDRLSRFLCHKWEVVGWNEVSEIEDLHDPALSPTGTSKNSNATVVHLPTAAERKARNLQNLFPLPSLPKEEKDLNEVEGAEDEASFPEAGQD